MQAFDSPFVPVSCSLAEIAMALDDRAVQIDDSRIVAAHPIVDREHEGGVDRLHLPDVAQAETRKSLSSGRRRRDLQIVTKSPGHLFLTKNIQIAEAVAANHEVGGQTQYEVLDRDAPATLLDRQTLEVPDQSQTDREVEEQRETCEGGDLRGGSPERDCAKSTWDLHLESAPSMVCGRSCTPPLNTRNDALFLHPSRMISTFHELVTCGSGVTR